MERDYELLKSVLSVPTKTYQEEKMVEFLSEWLEEQNIPFYIDSFNNVYATKGIPDQPDFIFPCVVAHTDTVHKIDTINIREEVRLNTQRKPKLALKAYNNAGIPTGIGGDDKCGVYACLELLKELPYLKAGFFVSEEVGCIGSRNSDPQFFTNVGYAIQFDAPENDLVTEYCFGTKLFDRNTEFFEKCNNVLHESLSKVDYKRHPFTDVQALKDNYDFQCINFSIGYYNYHTANEYVIVEDVYNGIEVGRKMIESLGYKKHVLAPEPKRIFVPATTRRFMHDRNNDFDFDYYS